MNSITEKEFSEFWRNKRKVFAAEWLRQGVASQMGRDVSTELGQITISDEVIALISGMAATECYGLVGMASRNIQDGIAELLGMDNMGRGVEVRLAGDEVVVGLYIIVEYGTKITEVAHNVMDKVRYVVESMTGLKVSRVNITIQGVRVTHAREDERE
jgi:uncharacterized alkaline shock family protein YloU